MDHPDERLCIALDFHDRDQILAVTDELRDLAAYVKINSAFTMHGPELVRDLKSLGVKVFLDLKLHDIPNTLQGYAEAVVALGVDIVTVHTAGGIQMMRTAVDAADRAAAQRGSQLPRLIGVTVLTSLDESTLNTELGIPGELPQVVAHRASLAARAGLDGLVCSPGELPLVRGDVFPTDALFVTPGTRSDVSMGDDHLRVDTHASAVEKGSSLLVIGREVTRASDRRAALAGIAEQLEPATATR